MDDDLRAMLEGQIRDLEQRIETLLGQDAAVALKANLLRSVPGIGPVTAAMLIA